MGQMFAPNEQGVNNTDVHVKWGVDTDKLRNGGNIRRNIIQVTVRVPVRHTVQEHIALQVFLKAVKRLKGLGSTCSEHRWDIAMRNKRE